jgi:hypothetical protein
VDILEASKETISTNYPELGVSKSNKAPASQARRLSAFPILQPFPPFGLQKILQPFPPFGLPKSPSSMQIRTFSTDPGSLPVLNISGPIRVLFQLPNGEKGFVKIEKDAIVAEAENSILERVPSLGDINQFRLEWDDQPLEGDALLPKEAFSQKPGATRLRVVLISGIYKILCLKFESAVRCLLIFFAVEDCSHSQ